MSIDQGIKNDQVTRQIEQIVEQTRKLYGLDKPVHQRYFIWLRQIVTLDFGNSYKDYRLVIDKIVERLPVTF